MPLLTSPLLLRTATVTTTLLATLLITSPTTILSHPTLSLLGSSMHIRPATFIPSLSLSGTHHSHSTNPLTSLTQSVTTKHYLTTSERELLALLGLVIASLSLTILWSSQGLSYSKTSLTARTTSDGKTIRKSSAEVGEDLARLLSAQNLFLGYAGTNVVGGGLLVGWIYLFKSERYGVTTNVTENVTAGWGVLANSVVFSLALTNMLFWGYLFTVLKEERREVLLVRQTRQEEDEEDEVNRGETR